MKRFRTRNGESGLKLRVVAIGIFFWCCGFPQVHSGHRPRARSLLSYNDGVNCTRPAVDEFPADLFTFEQKRHGFILVHFLASCYLFLLLAFVCDDYFVPSIKTLCDRLHVSRDVAGATFMAAAASSPELFINVVGTFVTKGDLGLGTIVGSAVFNILAVPACCGLFARQSVKIDWWPLTRDCLAYGATVVLLIAFLSDGYIVWGEALVLILLYAMYIIGMYYNDPATRLIKRLCRRRRQCKEVNLQRETLPLLHVMKQTTNQWQLQVQKDDRAFAQNATRAVAKCKPSEQAAQHTHFGQRFWPKCFHLLTFPITLALFLTIPDCRQEKKEKFWPLTFFMCMVWIAGTSYLETWLITIMGDTFGIPDSVMGLTFLAAGMSVPEATTSVIVTNQGHGAMGISSSIGSNTFDILLCLGLPWLIKSAFLPAEPGRHFIRINSQGLGYSTMSLLTTLAFLYASLVANRFVLDRKIGVICLLMYFSFIIFACLMELNVFFTVNLPTCSS